MGPRPTDLKAVMPAVSTLIHWLYSNDFTLRAPLRKQYASRTQGAFPCLLLCLSNGVKTRFLYNKINKVSGVFLRRGFSQHLVVGSKNCRRRPVWKGVINLYFLFQGDRNMYVYDECARCHELLPIQISEFVQ